MITYYPGRTHFIAGIIFSFLYRVKRNGKDYSHSEHNQRIESRQINPKYIFLNKIDCTQVDVYDKNGKYWRPENLSYDKVYYFSFKAEGELQQNSDYPSFMQLIDSIPYN